MKSFCYINGKITRTESGALPVTDLALQRGYGVFDYARTYRGKLFHFEDHLARLHNSAEILHLKVPLSDPELREIAEQLIQKSELNNPAVRILLTGGETTSLLTLEKPSLIMIAEELPSWPRELYIQGVKLITVEYQRELPHVKSLNYLNALRLEPHKHERGAFDLLYAHQGEITECPRNNFFVFRDCSLVTPADKILPGITRKVVIQLAAAEFPVKERRLLLSELDECDEAFLTSTSKEILPVTQINNQKIGSGNVGELTNRMMTLFRQYVTNY